MWKALIYKEWLKTRWLLVGLWLVGLGLLGYVVISLSRIFRLLGMGEVWDVIINRHHVLYAELRYYPVAFGILLALAQFIPEMLKKRFKLTLHLPMPQKAAYFSMQFYGFAVMALSFLLQLLLLYVYSSLYFPREIISNTFLTLLPWYIAGLTTYIFTAFICVEPNWSRRVLYAFLACGLLYICFLSSYPGAYQKVLWLLGLLPVYVFAFPWLSVCRFKSGIQ